jgi:predicted aldo/keto reductase-like oxidoreductase
METPLSRRQFLGASCAGAGLAATGIPSALAADEASSATAMPRRPLGKTGRLTSLVGFGGGSRYQLQEDLDVAERMIHRAIELGFNYFDTAYIYQKNGVRESYRRYGKFLVPHYRNQIFLTSKLVDRDAEGAKRRFEETLKELGTDHLDLLHFHDLRRKEEVDKIVAPNGALTVYRQWKEQGLIRAIGVTGHASADVLIDAIQRIEPDCVMCPQNPAHSGQYGGSDFARVIPAALVRGMGMLAMKTTAQETLIGKAGVTAEQLVRYTLNLPIATAVIGMPNLEVIESCAAIARSLTPMPEEERKSLEGKLASANSAEHLPYLAEGYADGHHCTG